MSETPEPKFGLHTNDLLIFAELQRDLKINTLQMMIPATDKFGYEVIPIGALAPGTDQLGRMGYDLFLHAAVTINLASHKNWVAIQSQKCLVASLELAEAMGAKGVTIHAGSWTEGSWEEGLERTKRRIGLVLEAYQGPVKILIENTAGKGTTMGSVLDNYAKMFEALPEQVGMTIDTAHAWGAGYDPIQLAEYLRSAPFKGRVGLVHFNTANANVKKGSGLDRHSQAFQTGATPPEELRTLYRQLVKDGIPMVIERGVDRGDELEQHDKLAIVRSDLSDMQEWAKDLAHV